MFRKCKSKKGVKNTKSNSDSYVDNASMRPGIEKSDSVTVYTNVMDVNELSESFSMSTVRSKRRIKKIQSSNSSASLDRKILEAEAKVKSQIRQLASESFDDDDDDSYYEEYHDEKRKMRLMTTTGVLLFDGLAEDVPDDRSLQSMIRKERREMASQYYEDKTANDLLTKAQAETNFIAAPKNYDPVKSGFFDPNSTRSFYDSDEDAATKATSSADSHAGSSVVSHSHKKKGKVEPSIEVVINDRSPLWKL